MTQLSHPCTMQTPCRPALSESLRELQSLEELRLTGCAQVQ